MTEVGLMMQKRLEFSLSNCFLHTNWHIHFSHTLIMRPKFLFTTL